MNIIKSMFFETSATYSILITGRQQGTHSWSVIYVSSCLPKWWYSVISCTWIISFSIIKDILKIFGKGCQLAVFSEILCLCHRPKTCPYLLTEVTILRHVFVSMLKLFDINFLVIIINPNANTIFKKSSEAPYQSCKFSSGVPVSPAL